MSFFKKSRTISSAMSEYFLQAFAFTALAIVAHFNYIGQGGLLHFFLFGVFFVIAVTCFAPLRVWPRYLESLSKHASWINFKITYWNARKVLYVFILINIIFLLISNFFPSVQTANNIGILIFFLLWIVLMSVTLIPMLMKKPDEGEVVLIIVGLFSLCGVIAMCIGFVKGILEIAQSGALFTDWAMTVSFGGAAVCMFGMFSLLLISKYR